MTSWTQKQTMNLIILYEQYPNLYKVRDCEYKNRKRKFETLREIADNLQTIRPMTTVKDIILKIKTLKTQHLKEKCKVRNSKRSGDCTEEPYVPKLWCYNLLRFWDHKSDDICDTTNSSVLQQSQREEPIEELQILSSDCLTENEQTTNKFHLETECSDMPSPPATAKSFSKRKHGPTNIELKAGEVINTANEIVKAMTNNPTSTLRPFLNNLEYEMNLLTDANLLAETRWNILEVVREAQLRQKTMNDSVCSFNINI